MRGMGDQVIRIPVDALWSLMTNAVEMAGWRLPRSVDIIGPVDRPNAHDALYPDDRYGDCVYLRIQHKYCMRRPKGAPLCIEDYHAFIERFRSTAKDEANNGH